MIIHTIETTFIAPGVQLPVRTTIVKDSTRLILISPVKFTDEHIQKINALGNVTDIVAPCLYHHLSVPLAMQNFPNARVWGVPGFEKKRPDIKWTGTITPQTWPHSDLLEVLPLEGAPRLNEVEFFHKATRTLIATDLCFNLRKPKGWAAGIVLRIFGSYNGFAVSRLITFLVKDKKAFKQSIDKLLKWDFDRIIPSHGKYVETGGKTLLVDSLRKRGYL